MIMRRGKMGLAIAGAAAVAFVGASASGQVVWNDGFEDYAPGTGIMGQGGWDAWAGDVAWDSNVTDANANSGTNSLDVVGDSDTIYRFDINHGTIDCGSWAISAQLFIPSDTVGANGSFFILLNTYDAVADFNWSTQVRMDPDSGTFIADFSGETLPLILDTWFEFRVDIDLDNDTQTVTIGGTELYSGTWTEQVSGGGQLQIQAMDLFAFSTTSVFYDDFKFEQTADCPTPICLGLEVDKLVGGGKSTWTVSDVNGSNRVVALVWGLQEGKTSVNGFAGYCATFGIKGVKQERLICQGAMSGGEKQCSKSIPSNFVGTRVLVQAAMRDTCDDEECMSDVLDMVIQ